MGVVFSKINKKKQRKKQRKKQQKKHFKYASSPRYYRSKNIYTLNTKPVTVRYIGYNGDGSGGTGDLNLPTITAKQEALVKIVERTYLAGGRQPGLKQNFGPATALIAAETDYNFVKKLTNRDAL